MQTSDSPFAMPRASKMANDTDELKHNQGLISKTLPADIAITFRR
jgi:hypothetical protein